MLIDAEFADQNAFTPMVRRTTALSLSDFFPFLFRRRPWRQIRDVCHHTITVFLLEVRTLFLAISNVLPVLEFVGRILAAIPTLT